MWLVIMILLLRLLRVESGFALLTSPPCCQALESCRIFSGTFHLSIFFSAVVCHLLGSCTSSLALPCRGRLHRQYRRCTQQQVCCTHSFPLTVLRGKVDHVPKHIFVFNNVYREIFFIKLDMMVQNIDPWTQLFNSELSLLNTKLIH